MNDEALRVQFCKNIRVSCASDRELNNNNIIEASREQSAFTQDYT